MSKITTDTASGTFNIGPATLILSEDTGYKISDPKRIDFDKVKTLQDVKVILESMDMLFYEGYECYDKVKPYLEY